MQLAYGNYLVAANVIENKNFEIPMDLIALFNNKNLINDGAIFTCLWT